MLKLPKRLHPEFKRPNIKPEGPFVLDTNNPIVDRLQHCFVVDGNSIVDLVTGRRIKTSSYTKTKHSIFGGELQVTTDDQYLADYFDIDRFDGNGDFSVVFRATTRNQGAVADISTVLELGAKTGTAKGYIRIQQHTRDAGSGVPGSYYFATYANYGTTACYVSGPGAPDYKRWDNAAFVRDGNNLIGYTDGAERYNKYSVSKRNIFYGGGGRIKLLQGQSTFQPSFSYLYVFTRALSPAEVKSLNDDPYQILKPANDLYYFSPVGGGGPSTYEVAASFNIANTLSTSKAADIVASVNYATALSNSSPAVMTAEVQASYSNILSMSGLGGAVYDVAASYDMSSGMSNGGLGDISASVNNNIISVLSSTALADMQALITSNIDMNYVISTDAVIGASATFSGGFGYTANFGDLAIEAAAGFALAFALSGSAQTDAYAELVNNVNTAISNSTNAIANATTTYTIGNSFVSLGGSDVDGNASFTITTDFASSSSISIEGACAFSTALGLVSSTIIQAESSVSFNVVSGLINSTLATLNAQASFGLQGSFSASRTYVTEAGASITITASMSSTGAVSVFGTVTTPTNRLIKVVAESRITLVENENRIILVN